MTLKTMSDIRADLTKQGFDDATIKDVIRARIELERANKPSRVSERRNNRLAKLAHSVDGYVSPQERRELSIQSAPVQRGLIMVGEW